MSEQNETRTEKKIVWFVQEGRMHSSWIIGAVDINVSVQESSLYTEDTEVLQNVLAKGAENTAELSEHVTAIRKHVRLDSFILRPGRWFFLSGTNVVHADDCYSTREAAADAYRSYLLGDRE